MPKWAIEELLKVTEPEILIFSYFHNTLWVHYDHINTTKIPI